jgi:hypothetical protein
MIIDLREPTIGAAWLAIAARILAEGTATTYDSLPITELALVALVVDHPDPHDEIIDRLADPARLAWMHANFTDHSRVSELGDADSYATRLFDYEHSGRDQVAWVIDRLRGDPTSRSAAITTFQPRTDTSYIPCVSLLDFWIRGAAAEGGAVELVVYAHSIDFGAKGYGNLVEVAALQHHVAAELARPVGRLHFIVKSAHVYDCDLAYITDILPSRASRLPELVPHRAVEGAWPRSPLPAVVTKHVRDLNGGLARPSPDMSPAVPERILSGLRGVVISVLVPPRVLGEVS